MEGPCPRKRQHAEQITQPTLQLFRRVTIEGKQKNVIWFVTALLDEKIGQGAQQARFAGPGTGCDANGFGRAGNNPSLIGIQRYFLMKNVDNGLGLARKPLLAESPAKFGGRKFSVKGIPIFGIEVFT